jgi:hypothetical protein
MLRKGHKSMTELLQELERKLAALPEEKQEQWVSHFLEELDAQTHDTNENTFGEWQWIGGRKPTQEEIVEAIEKIRQLSEGNILGDDITIKELINEGRRF